MFPATTTGSTRSAGRAATRQGFARPARTARPFISTVTWRRRFRYDGQDINTDRHLILHEAVEKTLIDQLNLHYLHAHQILKPQGVKAN